MTTGEIKAPKSANEKYCNECGEVIKARAEICPKCGVRQEGTHSSDTPKGYVRVKSEKFCSDCGKVIKTKAEICPHCGVRQAAIHVAAPPPSEQSSGSGKYCSDCGEVIKANAEICPKCGVRQAMHHSGGTFGASAPNGKSKIVAAILAFFLGGFGIHKFYLGQVGLGILYLVFFWSLIPWFIAFIEFILLLVMSDEEFIRRFGYS